MTLHPPSIRWVPGSNRPIFHSHINGGRLLSWPGTQGWRMDDPQVYYSPQDLGLSFWQWSIRLGNKDILLLSICGWISLSRRGPFMSEGRRGQDASFLRFFLTGLDGTVLISHSLAGLRPETINTDPGQKETVTKETCSLLLGFKFPSYLTVRIQCRFINNTDRNRMNRQLDP